MSAKKDYPLQLCSGCAAEYAAGGFRVGFARPKTMIVGRKCDFCGRHVPVYAARLDGKKRKDPGKKRKDPGK